MRAAKRKPDRPDRPAGPMLAAAVVLSLAVSAPGGEPSRTVHYQVVYADGTMRELSAVPATAEGIRSVLRITRVEQGDKGYEVLSTGPETLTLVNRGQTYRTGLTWNGKAWVAAGEVPRPEVAAGPATAPAGGSDRAALFGVQAELVGLATRLLAAEVSLSAAERALAGGSGKPADANSAAASIAQARGEIRAAAAGILAATQKLSPSRGDGGPPAEVGKVTPGSAAPKSASGIARPIEKVSALPHRVQVWKLPAGEGERTYTVTMAHPEAGPLGAFYYVAYADTTGDGVPDRLIARSPLALAETPGQWTQWSFATDQRCVFVGSTWSRPEASHYHAESIRVADDWRGLSREAYVSADLWGLPVARWGPCFGNIRVWSGRR